MPGRGRSIDPGGEVLKSPHSHSDGSEVRSVPGGVRLRACG